MGTWTLLSISLFSLAGKWQWIAELASHFKLQYFLLALGFLIFYLGSRNFKYAALNLFVLLINGYDIAPLFIQKETLIKNDLAQSLTLVQFNRYENNLQDNKFIQWLSKTENKFDIVLIQETNPNLVKTLKKLALIYPYSYFTPHTGAFGQVLLSKKEIVNNLIEPSSSKSFFYITAEIRLSQTDTFKLYGVHTMPPETPKSARMRNAQLDSVAKLILNDPAKTKIAIGDFNVTPYSYYFSRLEKTARLENTMRGFGLQNSWPSISPLSLFRIPIDHIFISKNIRVLDRKVGENFGSDHFPIIVKLAL